MKLTASAGSHARLRYLHSWYQAQFLHSPFADDLAQVPTIRLHPHPQQVHQPAPIGLPPSVMKELKASDVERQVDLGDAVMLVQVRSQQVPQSLGSVHMHLSTGILSLTVVDRLVLITYPPQELVDAILVGVDLGSAFHQPFDEWLDGDGLHVGQWNKISHSKIGIETKPVAYLAPY